MGFSPGIAMLLAVGAVLYLLRMAKKDLDEVTMKMEMEKEKEKQEKNTDYKVKLTESSEKELAEEKTKESVTEEQLIGSSKAADENSENEFTMTDEQAEAIYRFFAGSSFIGVVIIMVHMMSRMLSSGISLIDGVLSFAFFCFCSYSWMQCTNKMNEAKRKLEKEKIKE